MEISRFFPPSGKTLNSVFGSGKRMRQLNFLIIFFICLALVVFSIENIDIVPIKLVKGIELQAPLSIELIAAMGIGAVLAWLFSVWTQIQRMIQKSHDVRVRDSRIQELEKNVEQYKSELEQQRLLPAAAEGDTPPQTELAS